MAQYNKVLHFLYISSSSSSKVIYVYLLQLLLGLGGFRSWAPAAKPSKAPLRLLFRFVNDLIGVNALWIPEEVPFIISEMAYFRCWSLSPHPYRYSTLCLPIIKSRMDVLLTTRVKPIPDCSLWLFFPSAPMQISVLFPKRMTGRLNNSGSSLMSMWIIIYLRWFIWHYGKYYTWWGQRRRLRLMLSSCTHRPVFWISSVQLPLTISYIRPRTWFCNLRLSPLRTPRQ